jgi:hypothetical protein
MPEVTPVAMLFGLLFIAGCTWLALLPVWMYNRVKGIERALWAVVSQLQAMRREEHDPVQAALSRSGREVPAPTGMISTSMFGR